jgi:hypothetical protein
VLIFVFLVVPNNNPQDLKAIEDYIVSLLYKSKPPTAENEGKQEQPEVIY